MRKKVMAVVVAVLAFSLIAASAATLGGITTESVGADVGVVASCDVNGGVGAEFETSYVGNNYVVTGVTITGIDDTCDGLDISVTVSNNSGAVNESPAPGVVAINGSPDGNFVPFPLTGLLTAEQLTRVAVVISG